MAIDRPVRLLRRLRRLAVFVATSPSPAQWVRLALVGWARDNPSSVAARAFPSVRVRPPTLNGRFVTIQSQDLGQLISFEEIFVESVYDLDLVTFAPTAIFDCGAHVGYFAALASSAYPRVPMTVFEPNPDNLAALRHNLADVSGLTTIHAAAVSVANGTGRFSAAESNAGHLHQEDGSGVAVQVVDLAGLIPRNGEAALLIKIDIEGEERQLVPHLLPALPLRCAMFLETHHGSKGRHEMTEQLESYDFEVVCLRERGAFADLFAIRGAT